MTYGYCRVSTVKQEEGTSLDDQEKLILEQYPEAVIIKEVYTGTKVDRPLFKQLINKDIQQGDRLVITKLDRFCRNTKEGLETLDKLREKGVVVHILNMGLIDDTPIGRLITSCLLAFAEFEREQIRERCQGGRARRRATDPNYKEGRPLKQVKNFTYEYGMVQVGQQSVNQCCKKLHITKYLYHRLEQDMGLDEVQFIYDGDQRL